MKQAERLAAEHDPEGTTFNVGRVVKLEDGTVTSLEVIGRREAKAAIVHAKSQPSHVGEETSNDLTRLGNQNPLKTLVNGVDPDRFARMDIGKQYLTTKTMSKSQMKKQRALEPRPAPPKPIIPEGISIPEGEENWLALWNLADDQLERRVIKEKKRKVAERKALRLWQQTGKAERRAARDEKRRIYREVKLTWKAIKGM